MTITIVDLAEVDRSRFTTYTPRRNRTYTVKQRRQALALYKGGMSAREVSEACGILESTVFRWIRKAGISRTHQDAQKTWHLRQGSRDDWERRKRLYESGMTTHQVAALCGVTQKAVCESLRKMGVEIRRSAWSERRFRRVRERQMKAIRLWIDGVDRDEIQRRTGYSRGRLNTVLRMRHELMGLAA
jgi:transposase